MNTITRAEFVAAFAWLTLMEPPAWARGISGSGLAGSPHDFTRPAHGVYQSDGNADRCMFCHVGGNGSTAVGRAQWNDRWTTPTSAWNMRNRTGSPQTPETLDSLPLWNHEFTVSYASYTMYQNGPGAPGRGPKASQAIQNGMTPGSTSLLCLSCHDGSAAINSGNTSQLTRFQDSGSVTFGAAYVIGKDNSLANHHPIGFDYDAVRAGDKEIRSPDSARMGTAGTVRDHLYGPGSTRMECGTCHSVHNTGNTGETLLWRSDARSRLCLTCHDKGTDPVAMKP
jgi:predicted CXXCH cytochrome family protein